ncbi:MAG TPA: protein kinase [Thermoanaerobaculia bacterium]|nr:protein kinase [Thermoanaerobaculia bacterium]
MGIHAGFDELLQRRVMIKRVGAEVDAAFHRRLLDEARALSSIDHPNIPRVYSYDEGRFTLEPIQGKTLRAAAPELPFAERVRIAVAVASALAALHRAGLAYGALSADTIVITDAREVKLAGFALTNPDSDDTSSPDIAADRYALGLLLQFLFPQPDADVNAILAALLVEAPSDRATAASTLARLERLAQRPARRKRAILAAAAVVLVAGGAAKYTIDLERQRAAAIAAQSEAELRRGQASALLAFTIGNLHERLVGVGKLEILDSTAKQALAFFDAPQGRNVSAGELALNATALARLGEIRLDQGDRVAAQRAFERALEVAGIGVRQHPRDDELQFALGRAHSWVGNALQLDGNVPRAVVHMTEYATIVDELVRRHPQDTRFLQERAYAHSNLGTLLEQQEMVGEALAEYETGLATKKRILGPRPSDDDRAGIAVTTNKVAVALQKLGRAVEAKQRFREERTILESLLAHQPSNMLFRRRLAVCHDYLGAMAIAAGDLEGAQQHVTAQFALNEQLAAFDPQNMEWRRNLAIARMQVGVVERMRGNLAASLDAHAASDRLLQSILSRGTPAKARLRDMAAIQNEYGRTLLAANRAREAAARADRTVAMLAPMRNDVATQRFLSDALLVQGEARLARGDAAGARASWEDADAVIRGLAAGSSNPRLLDLHARVLLRLGDIALARPIVERLFAAGYRNREFVALWEKAAERKERT